MGALLVSVAADAAAGPTGRAAENDAWVVLAAANLRGVRIKPLFALPATAVAPAGQLYRLQLAPGADVAAAVRQLEALPAVQFVEPATKRKPHWTA